MSPLRSGDGLLEGVEDWAGEGGRLELLATDLASSMTSCAGLVGFIVQEEGRRATHLGHLRTQLLFQGVFTL